MLRQILPLKDIRTTHIVFMMAVLLIAAIKFDFSLNVGQVVLTYLFGLLTQFYFIKSKNIQHSSFLSTFISCSSIVLLLRTETMWLHPLCSTIAICSKYLIQYRQRHFFNPSALAIVLCLVFSDSTWVSSGQWGSSAGLSILLVSLGMYGVFRAKTIDISLFFLAIFLLQSSQETFTWVMKWKLECIPW